MAYSGAYTLYQWKITSTIWIQDLFTYDVWLYRLSQPSLAYMPCYLFIFMFNMVYQVLF